MAAIKSGKRALKRLDISGRRNTVCQLYLQGNTQAEIATQVGVSAGTVGEDIKAMREQWVADAQLNFTERKAQELAKIDNLESEAWEAWHRSCQDCEIRRHRTESVRREVRRGKGKGKGVHKLVPIRVSIETSVKGQSGDPRFLEQIAWCIETRLKMTGLLRTDITNVNQVNLNWNEMTSRPKVENSVEARLREVEAAAHVTTHPTGTIIEVPNLGPPGSDNTTSRLRRPKKQNMNED